MGRPRLAACLTGTLALCLLAGGTPERDIYITVALDGEPPAPDTVLVLGRGVLPTNVAPGQENIPALAFSINRASQHCDEPLFLEQMSFKVELTDGSPLDPLDIVTGLEVEVDALVIPAAAPRPQSAAAHFEEGGAAAVFFDVELAEPVLVTIADTLKAEVFVDIGLQAEGKHFTITIDEDQIGFIHERCSDPTVITRDEEGPGDPVAGATVVPMTLARSLSNYPNPFAAGRQSTTFAFYLPRRAVVSMRVYNGFGRQIRILEGGAPMAGGRVVDSITWDGRDDSGAVLQNGAYFAVLAVRYEDGTGEEAVRKVAVLR